MSNPPCPSVQQLTEYCLGKLNTAELDVLEKHVDGCHTCQDTVDRLDLRGDTFVARLREPASADPHQSEPALQAALVAARKPPVKPAVTKLPVAKAIPQPENPPPPTKDPARPATMKKWTEGEQPQTVDDFLAVLASSQLLEVEPAREFLRSLKEEHRPTDAKSAAVAFVNGGKLTAFQARALYQGKYQHLIIADREILDLLGKGGMGNVYKARHRRLDRIEALKVIAPKKLDSPEAKQRFAREARAAAKLNHPNVVTTYDAGEAGGLHFLAMEFIDGSDLARMVKERGPLAVEQAVSCTLQAAAGLQAAHAAGIVHRDIKPHNLLLDGHGKVKILDMGLARMNDTLTAEAAKDGLTQSGQIMGTIDFMSPEQTLDVHTVGPASDVYSLGCTLYYLITGRPPFDGESFGQKMMAHHHSAIPTLRAARPETPAALDAVYQKMLAKKVEDRFASMSEVIQALEKLGSTAATLQPLPAGERSADGQLDAFLSRQAVSQDMPRPKVEQTQMTATQVVKQAKTKKQPLWPWLAGVGLLCLAVVAAIATTYTIQTPEGTVEVAVAPEYADQVKVIVSRGGKEIEVDKQDDWKITLKEGKYDVTLDPASQAKFTLDRQSVSVSQKNKEVVKVTARAVTPAAQPVSASGEQHVLAFDGGDFIDIPNFKYDGSHPLTIEAKLYDGSDQKVAAPRASRLFHSWYLEGSQRNRTAISLATYDVDLANSNLNIDVNFGASDLGKLGIAKKRPKFEGMIDLAVIIEGETCHIFVNGKKISSDVYEGNSTLAEVKKTGTRIGHWVQAAPGSQHGYCGFIQQVRISKRARYNADYAVQANYGVDDSTMLLYSFDQPTGTLAKDLSPNKLDGSIVGCSWLPASQIKSRPQQPAIPASPSTEPARPEYVHKEAVWNAATGSWYYLSSEAMTYTDAAKLAEASSATPVIIDSQEENQFIVRIARFQEHKPDVWLGHVKGADGQLQSVTGEPVGYVNWHASEGKTAGEKNVYMMYGGRHADSYPFAKARACLEWKPPTLLAFAGDDYIDIPNFKYDGSHPLTFEARLTDWTSTKLNSYPLFKSITPAGSTSVEAWINLVNFNLDRTTHNSEFHAASSANLGTSYPSFSRARIQTMADLAVVFEASGCTIFMDGKKFSKSPFNLGWKAKSAGSSKTRVGAYLDKAVDGYCGFIEQIRISKLARYRGTYIPPKVLEVDADTLLLYRFDQPTGKVAKDLSPNKLDGTIVGATSVPASEALASSKPTQPPATLAPVVWHSVLPLVDPAKDTLRGTWRAEGGALVARNSKAAILIPVQIPAGEGYQAKVKFIPEKDNQEFTIVFPLGMSSRAKILLNYRNTGKSGLDLVNGKAPGEEGNDTTFQAAPLKTNQPNELEFSVRNSPKTVGITVTLNGLQVVQWSGPYEKLSLHYTVDFGHPRSPAIITAFSDTVATSITDFSISPTGKPFSTLRPAQPPTQPEPLLLHFDGNDYIDIPNLKYDGSHPLTFEARVSDWVEQKETTKLFVSSFEGGGLKNRTEVSWVIHGVDQTKYGTELHASSGSAAERQIFRLWPRSKTKSLLDVAVIFDKDRIEIYSNGRRQTPNSWLYRSSLPLPATALARIGANFNDKRERCNEFRGYLQHVRISKVARYTGDYVPPEKLEADADTMLLYRFDQNTGTVAKDLSANKLDGQIVGAEWVSAEIAKPPPPAVPPKTLASGQWHDLVPLVDPQFDTVRGTWTRSAAGLAGEGSEHSALLLPAEIAPGKSYDARIKFKFAKTQEFSVVCPVGMSRGVKVILNHLYTKKSGLDYVKGKMPGDSENNSTSNTPPLPPDVTHELEISVKNAVTTVQISARLNGKPVFDWQGPYSDLSLHSSGQFGHPRCPGIVLTYGKDASALVERFELRCADAPLQLLNSELTPEYQAALFFQNLGARVAVQFRDGAGAHNPKPLPFRRGFAVTYLDVGGTQVTDADMAKYLLALPNLDKVDLWDTGLGDPTFRLLGQLPGLRSISCGPKNSELTDQGVAALRPLAHCLQKVNLQNSPRVTSEGISALGVMPRVEILDLTATKFDEKMLQHVSKWPELSTLSINHLQLSRAHFEILKHMPKLRCLNITSTTLSPQELQYVREALPHCWMRAKGKFYNCQFKLPGDDLLKGIDPTQPPLTPNWIEQGGLFTQNCRDAEIALGSNFPAEYDLHLVVARHWSFTWNVRLPLGEAKQLRVPLERKTDRKVPDTDRTAYESRVTLADGKTTPEGIQVEHFLLDPLTSDVPGLVTLQVRKGEVRILNEGELACRILGDWARLPVTSADDRPEVFRIQCWGGYSDQSFRVHQAHLDASPPALKPIETKPLPKS